MCLEITNNSPCHVFLIFLKKIIWKKKKMWIQIPKISIVLLWIDVFKKKYDFFQSNSNLISQSREKISLHVISSFFFQSLIPPKNQIKHTNQCIFIVVCWRTRFSTSSNSNFWMYWRNGTRSWDWNLFFKLIWWFRRIEWKWCLNRWLHWNLEKNWEFIRCCKIIIFFKIDKGSHEVRLNFLSLIYFIYISDSMKILFFVNTKYLIFALFLFVCLFISCLFWPDFSNIHLQPKRTPHLMHFVSFMLFWVLQDGQTTMYGLSIGVCGSNLFVLCLKCKLE